MPELSAQASHAGGAGEQAEGESFTSTTSLLQLFLLPVLRESLLVLFFAGEGEVSMRPALDLSFLQERHILCSLPGRMRWMQHNGSSAPQSLVSLWAVCHSFQVVTGTPCYLMGS